MNPNRSTFEVYMLDANNEPGTYMASFEEGQRYPGPEGDDQYDAKTAAYEAKKAFEQDSPERFAIFVRSLRRLTSEHMRPPCPHTVTRIGASGGTSDGKRTPCVLSAGHGGGCL
jgi:hypothetical protein